MVKNCRGSFFKRYLAVFILLLLLVVVLPILVDQAVYMFSDGILPRSNSIIVFKDKDEGYKAISEFVGILKKLIKFI